MSSVPFDSYHFTLILVALITGVVSPMVVQITRYYISLLKNPRKQRTAEVVNILRIEEAITTKLESIKNKFKADRAWIIEFHNGNHTFTGKGLQKFSETYEVVGRGISYESVNTQNLPTSLFSSLFKDIGLNDIFYVKDLSDENNIPTVSSIRSFFQNRGVNSFIGVSIKNIEDSFIGILCLDKVTSVFNLNDAEISNLKQDASNIAGYLESIVKRSQE
jgi:hypoxanthine-guanine phosphoribosyltransferase